MYEARRGLVHSLKREGRSALAGAIAVGVGFGVSELYSGVITDGLSLIVAVGNAVMCCLDLSLLKATSISRYFLGSDGTATA